MNFDKLLKYLCFGTLAALIVLMMAATVLEKLQGTPAAFSLVYHHPLFIALWALTAVSGVIYLLRRGVGRKVMTLLLHLSFVLILAGALVTYLTGEQGRVQLREGSETAEWVQEDGTNRPLPFTLELVAFEVERYAGSDAAADYRSTVLVRDGGAAEEVMIAMNRILKRRGYRFYQAGFGEDGGSILSVNHDPWGIGLTYAGYLLLLVSMLGFFFQPGTGFRAVLSRVARTTAVAALLLLPARAGAQEVRVLPESVADRFGALFVYHNDRIAPLQTLARDYCLKAYGKGHYEDYSAEQVVTGWLFYYDWWTGVPFKLKKKDVGTARESEKEAIRMAAATGRAFRIFPLEVDGAVQWFSCDDPLPPDLDYGTWVFIRHSLDLLHEEVRDGNWAEAGRIIGKIGDYQRKVAGDVLPSPSHVAAERLYNRIFRPMVPFMASITLGILLFVFSGFLLARGRRLPRRLCHILAFAALALWAYLTLVLGLHWYVSGHAPLAGSYCVMMLMAWLTTLAMLLLYRRFPLVLPLGFLLAGFTMLVASLAGANPQITHLMPVLQSPLLSLHVLSMMVSYTLLGLIALCGVMGLCMPAGQGADSPSGRLQEISLLLLYPAVFILTAGTFLGAVWANISWGSYWAWDPKETWALVTLLVYAFALHGSSLPLFRRPKWFHAYCVAAFLCVLITYFGVNLFLGGMHAYA